MNIEQGLLRVEGSDKTFFNRHSLFDIRYSKTTPVKGHRVFANDQLIQFTVLRNDLKRGLSSRAKPRDLAGTALLDLEGEIPPLAALGRNDKNEF